MRLALLWATLGIAGSALALGLPAGPAINSPEELAAIYARAVDRRLEVPQDEQTVYASLLMHELQASSVRIERAQFVVLIDRSVHAQAAMLWWLAPDGRALLIGASPASTGRPRGFEHFETPTGVFDHSLDHLDFRAEGTLNEFGIRGYGDKGMRVYDFGWVMARRAWAAGEQAMRLQLHSTDRINARAPPGAARIEGLHPHSSHAQCADRPVRRARRRVRRSDRGRARVLGAEARPHTHPLVGAAPGRRRFAAQRTPGLVAAAARRRRKPCSSASNRARLRAAPVPLLTCPLHPEQSIDQPRAQEHTHAVTAEAAPP